MISNKKLSNFFKPTIFDELSFYETESLLIENQLKSIEISKQLKALKIQDLRSIIERISEEDYFDRFIDNRCLFTFEKKCNSSSLQDKVNNCVNLKTLCGMLTSNQKSPKESNSDDKGSENNEVSSKSDHLNSCILYWTQVINPQLPKSNNFRV